LSLIGCSFILEEAANPESAKDSVLAHLKAGRDLVDPTIATHSNRVADRRAA
jgi:hypothetical protein